jgi:protein gp37
VFQFSGIPECWKLGIEADSPAQPGASEGPATLWGTGMAEKTSISWTHHTFNPWRGCTKVSPGCLHCYAETLAARNPAVLGGWGPGSARVVAAEDYWRRPLTWDSRARRVGRRRRVFCASLADVFEDRPDLAGPRERLWGLVRATAGLDWLILTKRPENIGRLMPAGDWPNVWLGTSVEDRKRLVRIDALRAAPQRVPWRFVSAEPLLEDLGDVDLSGIGWLIVGGESGPGFRPMDHAWALSLLRQCRRQGVTFFFKQSAAYRSETSGQLGGRTYHEYPAPGD